MVHSKRRNFSQQEKQELWKRWKSGQSLSEIGRALGRHAATISGILDLNGGFLPVKRKRSKYHLSLEEREEISRELIKGSSFRKIALKLWRSPSTISREISRNHGVDQYRAVSADKRAWIQGCRPQECKLKLNKELCELVAKKLQMEWSPEQVSGWLSIRKHAKPQMQISHETIYKTLYMQTRSVLEKKLTQHLRRRKRIRGARKSLSQEAPVTNIPMLTSIHNRPDDVKFRTTFGHWEGDLISGSKNSHIAHILERKTRYSKLIKLEGKDSQSVFNALLKTLPNLPGKTPLSLTWDRGSEMSKHEKLNEKIGVEIYFCDPSSPWQKGSNENTNGLYRQYFPRRTELAGFSQADLDVVAEKLNNRPRKVLGFMTPNEKILEVLR
ncbi:MAG: IS30 family transposase [Pseudomonadota bacterium]|nr:IS30 family transposase [Pseudomonadota bacterium]